MMNQTNNKPIIVRDFSLQVLKLAPTDFIIFSYIFESKGQGISDTLDTLAATFNVSKRTVIKSLQFLTNKNYLIKKRNGQTITYWANLQYVAKLQKEYLLNPKNDNLKVNMYDDGDFDTFLYTDITKTF